ncbi:hypothetical protein GCM10007874_40290 [Labrys miyagiensis]|uniref:Uncharacterized protein n=2 Tax=Labrys miyagiensis TaxID=346912 RepID=A0ABQ6CRW3_9HYPH|nr:hypothetical protein GCM10007874_40290 [Labrys miyagiensis]
MTLAPGAAIDLRRGSLMVPTIEKGGVASHEYTQDEALAAIKANIEWYRGPRCSALWPLTNADLHRDLAP